MIAAAVQPQAQQVNGKDPQRRAALAPQENGWPRRDAASEQTHLQAIHASRNGVILRGQRHDTFWEW
jgi:hypothetical protein